MRALAILVSGLLFGAGLTVSGMVNPMKVLNFLDLAGSFDGTLIFVMGGALLTTLAGYHLIFRRAKPLFAANFDLPDTTLIDRNLIGGAALFGLGWGLTGLCPGPAVAGLVFFNSQSLVFAAAMAVGMLAARLALAKR